MNAFIKTAATLALATGALGTGALGTAAVFAAPASANDAPQISVSFADLNLSSESGTQILDRRIKNAIANVCGGVAPRDVGARRIYKRCTDNTAAMVQPKRDLAVNAYRDGRLAMNDRVIRFAAQ